MTFRCVVLLLLICVFVAAEAHGGRGSKGGRGKGSWITRRTRPGRKNNNNNPQPWHVTGHLKTNGTASNFTSGEAHGALREAANQLLGILSRVHSWMHQTIGGEHHEQPGQHGPSDQKGSGSMEEQSSEVVDDADNNVTDLQSLVAAVVKELEKTSPEARKAMQNDALLALESLASSTGLLCQDHLGQPEGAQPPTPDVTGVLLLCNDAARARMSSVEVGGNGYQVEIVSGGNKPGYESQKK